jgi:tetratricopeptide (TPR) repeat protein
MSSTARAVRSTRAELDPDALVALEEERDFLLRSLDDLDAEYAAGDMDEDDYRTLKDDYTARAAAAVRRIEERNERVQAARGPRGRGRTALIVLGVVVVGVVAGLVFKEAVGRRDVGDGITGDLPTSSRSLLDQGERALQAGDLEVAAAAFDDVLEIDPRNVDALMGKATIALAEDDVEGSLALYDEALTIEPDNVEALAYQGALFHRQGDPERALAQIDEAIALDPAFLDAWGFRLAILAEEGRFDEALAPIEDLAATGDVDIAFGIAQQASTMARTESALLTPVQVLEVYDALLAGAPDFAPALTYRAWEPASLAVSGAITGDDAETLLEDALVRLDEAVAADPDYADALVFRAIVLKNLGREAEAAEALAAFDATDPPAEMEALVEQFGLREALGE